MSDVYDGPFGSYTTPTEVISAAAQIEIVALFTALKAMIPDPAAGVSAPHPDFDLIPPATAEALRAEIDAASAAADAAPTS